MVVVGVQRWATLFAIHGFHTCYRCRYLSNEFAALKETFLLLFVNGCRVALLLFANRDPFLNREIGGFTGKMQMFENLAAEAKE